MGGAASAVGGTITNTFNGGGLAKLGGNKRDVNQEEVNKKAFTDQSIQKKREAEFAKAIKQTQGRDAPGMKAAAINQQQQAQFRQGQMGLVNQLQQQANGQGPSLAQNQLRQATDRNIQQQMAMAASGRGLNAGQGLRATQMNAAQANQQAAQQSADLRLQEQLAARQQLAGALESGRGQDIGLATNQAQLTQGANQTNLQAKLAQQQANDAMTQFYRQGQLGLDQSRISANQNLAQLQAQQNLGYEQLRNQAFEGAQQRQGDVITKLAGTGGALAGAGMAASDERVKKNVEPVTKKDLAEFVDALKAHKYEYKDEKNGEHEYISPMAQEMEKSELGKGMVENTPGGKQVNYARAGGVMLAAAGMLSDRMDELEKKLAGVFGKEKKKG